MSDRYMEQGVSPLLCSESRAHVNSGTVSTAASVGDCGIEFDAEQTMSQAATFRLFIALEHMHGDCERLPRLHNWLATVDPSQRKLYLNGIRFHGYRLEQHARSYKGLVRISDREVPHEY